MRGRMGWVASQPQIGSVGIGRSRGVTLVWMPVRALSAAARAVVGFYPAVAVRGLAAAGRLAAVRATAQQGIHLRLSQESHLQVGWAVGQRRGRNLRLGRSSSTRGSGIRRTYRSHERSGGAGGANHN